METVNSDGGAGSRLRTAAPFEVVISGRTITVSVDEGYSTVPATLDGLADAGRAGGRLTVVVTGGGGRCGLGRALVHLGLVRQALASRGVDPSRVAARWVDAAPDAAVRRWAVALGIEVT